MQAFVCLLTQQGITDSADEFRLRIPHPSNGDVILRQSVSGSVIAFPPNLRRMLHEMAGFSAAHVKGSF